MNEELVTVDRDCPLVEAAVRLVAGPCSTIILSCVSAASERRFGFGEQHQWILISEQKALP